MFHVVWKWFKSPAEFFMPVHNLAFIKKHPFQLRTLQKMKKLFRRTLVAFFPHFLCVVFQLAGVCIKYPYLDCT